MSAGTAGRYWLGRLVRGYLIVSISCIIAFPVCIYVIVPFIGWLTADAPYRWPTHDLIMKWVRYGVFATLWIGTIAWLYEFVPWLIKVMRKQ